MWLKVPALPVVNQVILLEIVCNNENHTCVTGVKQWVMWLLNAESVTCIVDLQE